MQYDIKGLKFKKEDLETLELAELPVGTISTHHLLYFTPMKPFLMLRAGDYIDQSFVDKYQGKGVVSFYAHAIADQKEISNYTILFKRLKGMNRIKDQRSVVDDIMKKVARDYWDPDAFKPQLNLIIAVYNEFFNLPSDIINLYQIESMVFYGRALTSATIAVLIALANGLYDHAFLQDIYSATFLLDYSLVKDSSSLLVDACEIERKAPGKGAEYLKLKNAPDNILQRFLVHPQKSFEMAEELSSSFNFEEVISIIRFQHENIGRNAINPKYHYSSVSHWELIPMLADYLTPFKEQIFISSDGHKLLQEAIDDLAELSQKAILPIYTCLSKFMGHLEWAIKAEFEKPKVEGKEEVA